MMGLRDVLERAAQLHGFEVQVPANPGRPAPPAEDVAEAAAVAARVRARGTKGRALDTIPAEFRWCRFDAPELYKRCDATAARFARDSERAVITTCVGPARSGKTSVATALFVDRLDQATPPTGLWVAANDMIVEAVRESRLGNEPPLLERARRVSVLLVDELGGELADDTSKMLVEQLVTKRHREHLPTIITTGLRDVDLPKRYSHTVVGRMVEEGRSRIISFRGRR
mgnify:CR=1 FL=1